METEVGIPAVTVLDPSSDVVAGVDPEIAALVEAVSAQQLLAYVQTLQNFGTRNTFSSTNRDDFGIGAAGQWIYDEFNRIGNGRLQVEFDDFPLNHNGVIYDQRNIVAMLPGRNEAHTGSIVLMAHYDSRSYDPLNSSGLAPGANDNGSGVAAMLEIARLLSSRTWEQTIVFVAFTAEEQGTHGSRHFVSDRLLEGWTFDATFDNDIVGGRPGISQSIRVFSPGPNSSEPRQLARYLDYVGGLYLPTFLVDIKDAVDREGRYSDHMRFLDVGVPSLRLTESTEDQDANHSGEDTWDKLDVNYLRQVTQLNLATIANIVGSPPPPAPTITPMADPGAFLFTWVPDLDVAGYVISFRPVNSTSYAPLPVCAWGGSGQCGDYWFGPECVLCGEYGGGGGKRPYWPFFA